MLANFEIIDSHFHIWDLSKFELPWLNDPAYSKLARSFLPCDYQAATKGYRVKQSVYVEVDSRPSDQHREAEYVLGLAEHSAGGIGGVVIGARPGSEGFRGYVTAFAGHQHVKGVREVLFDRPPGHCLGDGFIRGVQLLGELGLCFDVEIPYDQLADACVLFDRCPGTQFVLDHCGHPDLTDRGLAGWKARVSEIAARDNVAVKVSGLFSGVEVFPQQLDLVAVVINHLFTVFGSERLLFGSDWPVVTLTSSFQEWIETVWDIVSHRSETEVRRLFRGNAARIYGM
jgi:predicted TIM-barrel fold metal-dependent hydrolase